jgi:hypothetical protein
MANIEAFLIAAKNAGFHSDIIYNDKNESAPCYNFIEEWNNNGKFNDDYKEINAYFDYKQYYNERFVAKIIINDKQKHCISMAIQTYQYGLGIVKNVTVERFIKTLKKYKSFCESNGGKRSTYLMNTILGLGNFFTVDDYEDEEDQIEEDEEDQIEEDEVEEDEVEVEKKCDQGEYDQDETYEVIFEKILNENRNKDKKILEIKHIEENNFVDNGGYAIADNDYDADDNDYDKYIVGIEYVEYEENIATVHTNIHKTRTGSNHATNKIVNTKIKKIEFRNTLIKID